MKYINAVEFAHKWVEELELNLAVNRDVKLL